MLVDNHDFFIPLAFPVGILPSRLVCKKTRMVGPPDGEKILRICITVYTQYRRVTDRQTDRQTDGQTSCHGIVRAMHTRRAVKTPNRHLEIVCDVITLSRVARFGRNLVAMRKHADYYNDMVNVATERTRSPASAGIANRPLVHE